MDEGRDTINQSLQKRSRVLGRLPSLQPARDLTLGGIKRRVYVPNVNAKKNKDVVPSAAEANNEPKKKSRHRPPKEKKPFHRKEYIQSESIFADGPAAAPNLGRNERPSAGVGSRSDSGGGRTGLRLGGISKGDITTKKEDFSSLPKKEKPIDSFIEDLEEGDLKPIVYPRKDVRTVRPSPSDLLLKGDDDDYEELGLIQLVNPVPVEPTSLGIDPPKDGDEEIDFSRLPEGEFGKMQVLDTGEVRLVIGDKGAMVKVLSGTPVDHLMELIRIRVNDEVVEEDEDISSRQRSGEMHVLGRIENRFVCAVNFDSVFQEMAREREARGVDSDSDTDER